MSEKQKRLVLIGKEEKMDTRIQGNFNGDFNCKLRKV